MATVYDIIQGINQAAANAGWDGAHEENLQADGKARDAGLKRQDGHYINDRRVMDGFGVVFHGPILRIKYQSEVRVQYLNDLEPDEKDLDFPIRLAKRMIVDAGQANVEQHQLDVFLLHQLQRHLTGRRAQHVVVALQHGRQRVAHSLIVVDDEDGLSSGRHAGREYNALLDTSGLHWIRYPAEIQIRRYDPSLVHRRRIAGCCARGLGSGAPDREAARTAV